MRHLQSLRLVCFTVCVVSLLAAVTVGLLMVWGGLTGENGWRFLLTSLILFLGAGGLLSVTRVMLR